MNMGGNMKRDIDIAPDQHAFVMLGERTLFLCHITMFHAEEHRFQMVLRATLPAYAMQAYVDDRAAHPDETYFLGNSVQDLITVPSLQAGVRKAFIADIFRGIPKELHYLSWPWEHSAPLVAQVPLTIDRIVYARHFDFGLEYPQDLTYIVFGSGDESHLTHYQVKEPDYDHVLSLRGAPAWLPPLALESSVHLNFPNLHQTMPYCFNPLPEAVYEVTYAGLPQLYTIEVGKTHWFSTKMLNEHDPCPEHEGP